MKNKSEFSLYKRKDSAGKIIWQYTCYDSTGNRRRYSTGKKNKTDANAYCLELLKAGRLVPEDAPVIVQTFSSFSAPWWKWDSCPYVMSKRDGEYQIGHTYVDTCRMVVDTYLLPALGSKHLDRITVSDIEDLAKSLKKNLSGKSVRNYVGVLSVMLDEALRLGLIKSNPCKNARTVSGSGATVGVPTLAEARLLFSRPDIWKNYHAYLASLLAACTGMRCSEIRALRCCDIKATHVHVEYSIEDRYGQKSTKTGDVRDLPVPARVLDLLHSARFGRTDEDYLLRYKNGKPYGRHMFLDNLHGAMDALKIDWKGRRIVFHSWRHFLNTQLLSAGVSRDKTREITGHQSDEMTTRYTDFQLEDFKEILDTTEQILQ